MRVPLTLICFVVIALVVACGSASAQTSPQSNEPVPVCDPRLSAGPVGSAPCEIAPAQESAPADDSSSQPLQDPSGRQLVFHYTSALNGGEPIILPQPFRLRYLFGAGATQGFDSAAAGPFRNLATGVSATDGYVAASLQSSRSYFLLQHASTITHYSSPDIHGQIFHRTAFVASAEINKYFSWTMEGRSTLGDDALRLVNPLPARMVGQYETTEPVSAAYGIDNGRIWGTDLVGSLNWSPDPLRTFKLQLKDAYHRTFTDDLHNNIANARLEYLKKATARTSYGFYGQGTRETGELLCNSTGAGFEVTTKPSDTTMVEFALGPEFGSSGCGRRQAVNVHAAVAGALTPSTRAYLTANREFSSGYVRRSTWEDNVVVGLGKRFTRQISWGADVGYVKGTLMGSVISYQGYFASTEIRKRLSDSFTALTTYRRFDHSVSNLGVRRNVVMLSLVWAPSGHDAQRVDAHAVREQVVATGGNHED